MDKSAFKKYYLGPRVQKIYLELVFFCEIPPKKLIKVLLKRRHFVIIS